MNGRDYLCKRNCKHLFTSHYDPSPSGVHMGSGYMVEEECEFLDRFDEDDTVDDYDRPKPDVVYEMCPFYETYTQEELDQMKADDEAEMEFLRQMDEEAKKYKDEEIDDPYITEHWGTFSQEKF